MGVHDDYGKTLLERIFGSRFDRWDPRRIVTLAGIPIYLDGVISGNESSGLLCAVEIEAENEIQVRGAVSNLFLHPAPKVLLLLMRTNLNHDLPDVISHLQELWKRLTSGSRGELPIICLKGDGHESEYEEDGELLRAALSHFGIDV